MRRTHSTLFIILTLASLILVACTPASAATETSPEQATTAVPVIRNGEGESGLPEVDPGALSGDIYAAGSSTVYPLIEAIAEDFNADGFEGMGQIKIDSVGTGGGFERFCATGESDIANASRAIKDSEAANCANLNPVRTPIEFRVGTDAIAVVVSRQNNFLTNVTLEELARIYSNEAETWADVNPDWPEEPIQRFSPGTDSGTFDFFVETVIQKPRGIEDLEGAKAVALSASNLQTSEDDNVLVQGVEGSPYAIGYFGFAYFQENQGNLTAVAVDGVAPSAESAESGEYALARPLYIYSDAQVMKSKPQVAGFINYFLSNVNDVIGAVGYFPASEEALNQARQAWLEAMQ